MGPKSTTSAQPSSTSTQLPAGRKRNRDGNIVDTDNAATANRFNVNFDIRSSEDFAQYGNISEFDLFDVDDFAGDNLNIPLVDNTKNTKNERK